MNTGANLHDIEALLIQLGSLGPNERSQEQALGAEASGFIVLRRHLAALALPDDIAEAAPSGQDEVSAVWRAIAALKASAIEASRLAELQREVERQHEMELRQIMLD